MRNNRNMKQIFIFTSIAIFSLVIFGFNTALAKTITLTFATNNPPAGLKGDAEKIFIEELEKASNGQIKVKPFWAGSLLNIKEMLKGISDGIVDMGYVNVAYYPKKLTLNSGILLVDQGPVNYQNKINAFRRIYTEIPELKAEIEKFNQKIVYMYTMSPVGWCFNKPVKSISEINGLKVRTSSRWAMNTLKDLGAAPVSLPFRDLYVALQTNSIQGVVTNLDSIHRAKLHEVAPHILTTNKLWTPLAYFININQKKWNKLSDEMKDAFKKAAINAEMRFSEKYTEWLNIIESDMKKSGCTITAASPEDYSLWLNSPAQEANIQAWIASVSKAGITNAEVVFQGMKRIAQEEINKEK